MEGFFGDGNGNVGEFEENGVGFDDSYVVFYWVFIGIYVGFGGFFGDGFVGENVDLEFVFVF